MGRTIDDRVVSASFETSKFESGVNKMLSGIDKLKKSMHFENAGKGLDQLNASANRVNFSHMSNALGHMHGQFKNMEVVGIAVMANLATSAVGAGTRMVKAFTFAPVIDGLHEYENQLNAVQTILGNTKDAGTNLTDVNKALNQLNQYADKTIYNFGQMTKNVGTFTAAGVDLETSVASIKGISNLAALSGSSAEQASTAMYQLSQAISAGRVGLQDWNSVVNAGMGGAVFQKALMRTAENMGALKDGAVSIDKATGKATVNGQSFRQSIMAKPGEQSWLTGDVLTNTLKQLSGDMTDAQLKAEGFSDAQIKAIQAQSKMALDAATKVKTLHQLLDTTKEAIGSGWAKTWMIVLGDFGEAKKLFTALAGAIGGFVQKSADARNKVLEDWKKLGGRTLLLDSLKRAFHALGDVIAPIKDAFRDIFPKKTGKDLFEFTKRLDQFTKTLVPSKETVENLRRTFRGFFAILHIGKTILGGVISVIGKLFGAVGDGSGGFLNLTGNIGDWLVKVDEALTKGGALTKFFDKLGDVIRTPIDFLVALGKAISDAFSGDSITKAGEALGPLQQIINGVVEVWDKFLGSVGSTREIVRPALEGLSQMFGAFGETVAEALKGADFDAVFKVIEIGLIGGIFFTLKKALSGGLGNALAGGVLKSIVQAFTGVGGLSRSIGGTFNALTGSIKTMQQNVKSDTLKNIAISIALLSASIIGLSLVDPKRLNSALTAITIGFGQLLGAMAIMDKIGKSGGFIKMPVIAASMVILAGAIALLSLSVAGLSRLSWEELAKGLGAVSVLLIGITSASGPLSANSAGMIRAGTGITIIAVAMNILAQAVKSFGGMDMGTLAKGIGGISVALAGIGAAANLFPSGMVAMGIGLIAIGTALKLIAGTIQTLGDLDMSTLAKGIGAIGLALAAIGLTMSLMPGPSMVLTAAGLVLVGVALNSIAKVIGNMGDMSIEQISKGLGTLAASLALLAIGLLAMSGTLGGSAALFIAASGIAILAPALKTLGDQSWGQIVKGLVALAAAFALLGVAGVVLAPVAPAILALGVALIAVGAGLALAGAGVALIGIGLGAIAVAGPAAVKILVDALVQLAEALPKVIQGLVKALLQLVESVAKAAPKFVVAIGKIISLMAKAIVLAAPELEKAFVAILELIFNVLRKETPNLIKTGIEMLKALLKGIGKNIGSVVKMVVDLVAKFLGAIASNIGKLVTGGAKILAAILKGIANGIGLVIKAAVSIITSFLRGISNNIRKVAKAGVDVLAKWLKAIADGGTKILRAGTNVIVKFVKGIGDAGAKVVTAALKTTTKFITTIAKQIPKEVDKIAGAIIKMMNALAPVIRKREAEFIQALGNIGIAIGQGIVDGLTGLGKKLAEKIADEVKSLPKNALKGLGKLVGAASVKLPDGLGTKFGKTFTDEVLDHLSKFEDGDFQKNLAKIGGAENIEFLFNMAESLSGSFYDGLLSGIPEEVADPVEAAFEGLKSQLSESQGEIENTILDSVNNIKKAEADVKKIEDAKDKAKDIKDKKKRQRRINDLNDELRDVRDQRTKIREEENKTIAIQEQRLVILKNTAKFIKDDKSLNDQIEKLKGQHTLLDQLNKDLETNTQLLEDVTAKRDDLFKDFSAVPGLVTEDADGNPIDAKTQVENYIASLSNADDVVSKFGGTLDELQKLGLNKDTYQQLLDIGPAAQGFADALLKLGPDAVAAINGADSDLRNAASTLAEHGASEMYGVGVATAQGMVDGIKSKIDDAIAEARNLAKSIVKAIKHTLGIKSPSQVFAEIGAYSVEGMAVGFKNSSKVVTDAVYGVSDEAKAAIKKSMSGISEIVSDSINPNPTITPILDLSEIQAGSSKLGSILTVPATASLALASSISSDQEAMQVAKDTEQPTIKFEQHNTSPKALSEIEIYRQTRNQLAQARPVLVNP